MTRHWELASSLLAEESMAIHTTQWHDFNRTAYIRSKGRQICMRVYVWKSVEMCVGVEMEVCVCLCAKGP